MLSYSQQPETCFLGAASGWSPCPAHPAWPPLCYPFQVGEFAIGFGPVVARRESTSGIAYVLRALPLGGFVSFPRLINKTALVERGILQEGEELNIEDVPDGPDLLERRPLREQALVISAGVVANLVLTWTLLFSAAMTLGVPVRVQQPVVVSRVVPSSVAERAGFRSGDRIVQVGSLQLNIPPPLVSATPALPSRADSGVDTKASATTASGADRAASSTATTSLARAPRERSAAEPSPRIARAQSASESPTSKLSTSTKSLLDSSLSEIKRSIAARQPFTTVVDRGGQRVLSCRALLIIRLAL